MGDTVNATPGQEAPKDPNNLVLILFKLLGMGCLLPWNFFISVADYWMYKFRNVDDLISGGNLTVVATLSTGNAKNETEDEPLSELQMQWNSYLSIASMIPNVTFLLLNAAVGPHFK